MCVRKNYLCLKLNRYPRTGALLLWKEKIEKSSKFATPEYHEEQLPGAFWTQQLKCGCALLGLHSNPTCDTAVTLMKL